MLEQHGKERFRTDAQQANADEILQRANEYGNEYMTTRCRELARQIADEIRTSGSFDPSILDNLLNSMTWLPKDGEEVERVIAMLPSGISEQVAALWNTKE